MRNGRAYFHRKHDTKLYDKNKYAAINHIFYDINLAGTYSSEFYRTDERVVIKPTI